MSALRSVRASGQSLNPNLPGPDLVTSEIADELVQLQAGFRVILEQCLHVVGGVRTFQSLHGRAAHMTSTKNVSLRQDDLAPFDTAQALEIMSEELALAEERGASELGFPASQCAVVFDGWPLLIREPKEVP